MVKIICEGVTDKNKIKEFLSFLGSTCSDDSFIVTGDKSSIFKKDSNEYRTLLELYKAVEFKEKNNHKYIMEQLHKITTPNKPYDFTHTNFRVLKEKLNNLYEI